MDISAVRAKLAALQNKKSGGQKRNLADVTWRPSVGKQTIRIVPSAYQEIFNEHEVSPLKELYVHYEVGSRPMLSLLTFGEKDPIVNFAEMLKKGPYNKESWTLSKKIEPKLRVIVPVVVRGEEEKGVRLWEFGKQIYEELLAFADDPDIGDFTDILEGRDFTVETTTPEQNGSSFNQSKIRIRTKTTPLSTEAAEIEKWTTQQPDPMSLYQKMSFDELADALVEYLNPEETSQEEDEEKPYSSRYTDDQPKAATPKFELKSSTGGSEEKQATVAAKKAVKPKMQEVETIASPKEDTSRVAPPFSLDALKKAKSLAKKAVDPDIDDVYNS